MNPTNSDQESRAGDAAVGGLLNGIFAGAVMMGVILLGALAGGTAPLPVLGYFDVTDNAAPLTGVLVHLAVAGVYGVLFGVMAMLVRHALGARMNWWGWLALGILYGLCILGIAQGIILPRTTSEVRALPIWILASAHLVYGIVLAVLQSRARG
jgi:hypothetical protein